jgi:hypothetical protein
MAFVVMVSISFLAQRPNEEASASLSPERVRRDRVPRPINPVILALVAALRDVEQRRGRGKVLTHLTSKRPAA